MKRIKSTDKPTQSCREQEPFAQISLNAVCSFCATRTPMKPGRVLETQGLASPAKQLPLHLSLQTLIQQHVHFRDDFQINRGEETSFKHHFAAFHSMSNWLFSFCLQETPPPFKVPLNPGANPSQNSSRLGATAEGSDT